MPRPCTCDRYKPGMAYEPSQCRPCWLWHSDQRYRTLWGGNLLPAPQKAPCRFLGGPTGEVEECPTCVKGRVKLKVFSCEVHGKCVQDKSPQGIASCATCPERSSWPVRFDENNLGRGLPGRRFNPSLLAVGDRYLFSYRDGWAGSEIWLTWLDGRLRPQGHPWKLNLFHPEKANFGREDPRLFRHRGKIHIAYAGVTGDRELVHTSVLYASLGDDLQVEKVYYPYLKERNFWEKNHSYFSHGGDLYAVYSIAPHRIIRVEENRAWFVHETIFPTCSWHGGEMRGGAAPVLVDGEWWCFMHDRTEDGQGHRTYRVGLYTFDDRPPFRVKRFLPEPLLVADRATKPHDQYSSVAYPCGSVFNRDHWLLSLGIHDRWAEIHKFDHVSLEKRLLPVGPPRWFSFAEEKVSPGIFGWVVGFNEYHLPEKFSPDDLILDIGAHIGSFTYACHSRGARKIYAFETEETFFKVLEANCKSMGGPSAYHIKADGDTFDGIIMSSLEQSGKERVRFLKMDIEGCEYDCLEKVTLLHLIDEVALEYHPMPGKNFTDLLAILKSGGLTEQEHVLGEDGRGLIFAKRSKDAGPS